jgi:RNAse R (EC 3.1.-.-)
MQAERDALSRFIAAYMAEHVGATFEGSITGVTRFGLFVALTETGAEGFVPIATLSDDYYEHDEAHRALVGKRSKNVSGSAMPLPCVWRKPLRLPVACVSMSLAAAMTRNAGRVSDARHFLLKNLRTARHGPNTEAENADDPFHCLCRFDGCHCQFSTGS